MATATSYGSITIVDITDIGEFSVYPTANLPLSVIYNPDQNSYTPNWGTANLELIPYVYYAGKQLPLASTSGLTITWKRQEGTNGSTETLNTGETVVNGELHVTANQFTPNSSMLTYIVVASYLEPTSNQTLTAQGQITFSLVKQASSVKNCYITGETVFKYNTDGNLVGASSITLSATVNSVEVRNWQYKTYDGSGNESWSTYPFNTGDSATKSTLTVKASDNVFFNDVATIKLITSDNSVYDIHSITKLRDGAVGSGTVSGVLTNDDQMIPFVPQSDGSLIGDFSDAISQVIIYEGGVDVTSSWAITQSYSNVTATASTTTKANDTVTVTAMSGNTGNVTFTCKKAGYTDIIKTFSLVKVTSGVNGESPTIYSLSASTLAMNRDNNKALTPNSVTFTAYSKIGNANKALYSGRFKIFENDNTTASYTSTSNESSYTFTPSSDTTNKITCNLYAAGGTSTLYDTQTVVITTDGTPGQQGPIGPEGKSAINVILGNYADVIPCTSDNTTQTMPPIVIPFSGYKGTTKVACTLTTTAANAKLFGVTPTIKQATASADGSITWNIGSGVSVSNNSGTLSLTFSCEGQTITHTYRWTRSTAALNGTSPIILQVYAPNGDIFNNGSGSLPISVHLYDGSTDKTSSATYQWAKYSSGSYTDLAETANYSTGTKTSTCTIFAACVDGYASFRCTATYNGDPYVAYISLRDKSDPIQVSVFSSVGSQLLNGNGHGALYVKVTKNGTEIDPIKSERFVTTLPTSGNQNGDYIYLLNTSAKTVTLYKYTTKWNTSSETYEGTYMWTYRDKDGNPTTTNTPAATGKVIYVDGDLVDKKLICDVQVTV